MAMEASILHALPFRIVPKASVRASVGPFPIASIELSVRFRFTLSQSRPLTAAGNVSRVDGNGEEEAGVGEDEEEEKNRI